MFIFKKAKEKMKDGAKYLYHEVGCIYKIAKRITSSAYQKKNLYQTLVANSAAVGEVICDVSGNISIYYGIGWVLNPNYRIWAGGLTLAGYFVYPVLSKVCAEIHDRWILDADQTFSDDLVKDMMRKFYKEKPDVKLNSNGSRQITFFCNSKERYNNNYFKNFFQSGKLFLKISLNHVLLGVYGDYAGLASLLPTIFSISISLSATKKLAAKGAKHIETLEAKGYAYIHDAINRGVTAILFGKTHRELEKLNKSCLTTIDRVEKNKIVYTTNLKLIQNIVSLGSSLLPAGLALYLFSSGALPINNFLFIASLLYKLNSDIRAMEGIYAKWASDYMGLRNLIEYFEGHEYESNANQLPVQTLEQFTKLSKENGYWVKGVEKNVAIEFDHVILKIKGKLILNDISFKVKPRETLIIMGLTGAGKTTIFNLMLRLEEPTSGRILFNGVDIKKLAKKLLWELFSLVPQNLGLINDSIPNNIKYGNEKTSNKEIREAEDRACLTKDLHKIYEKKGIGYNGGNLSGGEQQRLAIARSYARYYSLGTVSILALDELTKGLDPKTEDKVLLNLAAFLQKNPVTCLIITHHLRSVLQLKSVKPQIVVLSRGKIVEKGSFDELMTNRGQFNELMLGEANLFSKVSTPKKTATSVSGNSNCFYPRSGNNKNKDEIITIIDRKNNKKEADDYIVIDITKINK